MAQQTPPAGPVGNPPGPTQGDEAQGGEQSGWVPRMNAAGALLAGAAALVGAFGTLHGCQADDKASAAPTATVTVTVTAPAAGGAADGAADSGDPPAASATPAAATSDSAAPGHPGGRAGKRMTLVFEALSPAKDLDADPPAGGDFGPATDIGYDSINNRMQALSGSLAPVTGTPSEQECKDAATTGSSNSDPLKVGDELCVVTSEGSVALLRLAGLKQDSSYLAKATFDATVWHP
ncbi:hypothetical protein ACIQGZ_29050 [Streptomyces sp. NPDC092296]|uniref:hypothetical protein n=1 Tax=Streptomyces sp. NPDC092296 TaxID=3366012 RepID=UPI0037F57239